MKDDRIDMDAVCAALDAAVQESLARSAAPPIVEEPPTPPSPRVVDMFSKKAVVLDAPMSESAQKSFDQVVNIARDSGANKIKAYGVVLLHEDGTMTRSFHVDTGYWCAALGAVRTLEWAIHEKYNEPV